MLVGTQKKNLGINVILGPIIEIRFIFLKVYWCFFFQLKKFGNSFDQA